MRPPCLRFAQGLVSAKILNCRTLLRRNWKRLDDNRGVMIDLKEDSRSAERAHSLAELLGIEGAAAARDDPEAAAAFDFKKRNRRPPTDPVNALLSFAYSLLVRSWTVTLTSVGFDAYRGLYHQPRYGRPALALDLMEPFRPIVAESVVLQGGGRQRRAHCRRQAQVHRRIRAAAGSGGRAPAVRLPGELPPSHGDAGSPVRPLPAGRDRRLPELPDPLIACPSISTSSSTTSPTPSAGARCSR